MRTRALLIASLGALALPALAQNACTKADMTRAEKAIERVSTWPQLTKAFRDHGKCDVGPVDEVFTESLIRLLVEWKDVDGAVAAYADPAFKEFANRHLRSPAAKDDANSVYSRAKASCPPKHEAFCTDLAAVAKAASADK